MKLNKDNFLFSAKDNLISKKNFDIYWDSNKFFAWTDIKKEKDLSKYYDSKKYDSFKQKPSKIIDYLYSLVQTLMLKYKWSIIRPYIKGKKNSLDIGSGVGVFGKYCLKKGLKQVVVESNLKAFKIGVDKGLKSFNSLKKIPLNYRYQVITLWHSLEHIPNLNETLKKINTVLNNDGILVIAVPNLNSFDSKYYGNNWAAFDVPRHLWHFTEKGLELLLSESNFLLIKSHPMFMDALYISYLSVRTV